MKRLILLGLAAYSSLSNIYDNNSYISNSIFKEVANIYSNQNRLSDSKVDICVAGDDKVYFNDIDSDEKIVDNWAYNEVKTINIDADLSMLDSKSKYLEIELPVGMKMGMSPEALVDDKIILSVDKSEFGNISYPTHTSSTYTSQSGLIRYEISPSVKSINLDILMSVDNILWDTRNQHVAKDNQYAIKVTIGDKDTSRTQKLDNINITNYSFSPWYWNELESKSMVQNENKSFGYSFLFANNNSDRLFKELEVILEKPHTKVIENGVEVKKYLDIKSITLEKGGTIKEIDNKIICTWNNIKASSVSINFTLYPDKDIFNPGEVVYINYLEGNLTGLIHEEKYKIVSKKVFTSTIYSNEVSTIKTNGVSREVYKEDSSIDYVNVLGQYRLINIGIPSSRKSLKMEFPTKGVGVKTVRLPVPKESNAYSLDVVLWDYVTKEEIEGTVQISKSSSNLHYNGYLFTFNDIKKYIDLDGYDVNNLFIKSIEYEIGSLPGDYDSGSDVDSWSTAYSGKMYGKVLEDGVAGGKYKTTYTLTDLDNSFQEPIINESYSNVTDKGKSTVRFSSVNVLDSGNKNIFHLQTSY